MLITTETKNKIENISQIKELIKGGILSEEEFEYIAENDKSLKRLKSNFFKIAKQEKTVKEIEAQGFRADNTPLFEPKKIARIEFDQCILPETAETETDTKEEQIKIYIVAPVLIKGRKDNWKGMMDDVSIDFKMNDKDFLDKVHRHEIKFSNGTFINCVLKTTKTTKYPEEKTNIAHEIIEVLSWGEEENIKILKRKRKRQKTENMQQVTLFECTGNE